MPPSLFFDVTDTMSSDSVSVSIINSLTDTEISSYGMIANKKALPGHPAGFCFLLCCEKRGRIVSVSAVGKKGYDGLALVLGTLCESDRS